jgi:SH3-like domain-containing protein
MTAIVIKRHKSNYHNPIRFEKGERVRTGKLDSEYPGWVRVITKNGNEGWAPVQYLSISEETTTGIAKSNYTAKELNTELNEELVIHLELNNWYWAENSEGDCGWVPRECIRNA